MLFTYETHWCVYLFIYIYIYKDGWLAKHRKSPTSWWFLPSRTKSKIVTVRASLPRRVFAVSFWRPKKTPSCRTGQGGESCSTGKLRMIIVFPWYLCVEGTEIFTKLMGNVASLFSWWEQCNPSANTFSTWRSWDIRNIITKQHTLATQAAYLSTQNTPSLGQRVSLAIRWREIVSRILICLIHLRYPMEIKHCNEK